MPQLRLPRAFLVVVAFLLAVSPASPALAQTAPLAPQERMCDPAFEDCRADLLTYIQQETVGIDMAYWLMTDARYSNALVSAWQRGVKIRLLMDPRCSEFHPACVAQNDQLRAAGIPMRNRQQSGILHWKAIIFAGQGQVEFAGANYSPFEMSPEIPFVNYTDEIVAFTNDPSLVQSFMRKFDDMWVSQTEFADYANITAPLTRSFPLYDIDPELNFPPDEGFRARAVAAYDAENTKIDVVMFRITDGAHPDAMLRALRRGVPVRMITDEQEYRNPLRLMDAYYVDLMHANGVEVRFDGHQGINHEKAVALHGTGMSIIGSSNWTDASNDSQREHNYFTVKPWIFTWLTAQFERKWTNGSGYSETKPFVPLPPDAPLNRSPANGATGVPANAAALAWAAGVWAHKYDIYFGTNTNPPLLYTDRHLGPSRSSSDDRVVALPALEPGTTYYWRIVSKTMAGRTAEGPIHSFTTEGVRQAANVAPAVSLTSPASGSVPVGQAVSLTASASDSDGTINKVDFFANGTLIGTSSQAPYTTTWSEPAAGSYTLTAVATDSGFAATTSPGVSFTVSVPPAATLVRGPYLQQPTDHSMVVAWATRDSGAAQVRYGVSTGTARTSVPATSRLVPAAETGLAFDYYQHVATLGGLAPGTSYAYQAILAGTPMTGEATFKTAPLDGTGTISFVAFGDSGTGSAEQRQLGQVMARDSFDLAMHLGDIAYGNAGGTGAATYATYQSYLFDIYAWLPARAFVPVAGNHDSRPANGNGKAYLDLFELPRNGASAGYADHAERYYSFDYGPVHFVALDTEFAFLDPARQAEQLRWLAADLSSTSQPWKVVFLHRAPYSSGGENGSSPDVRAAFGPLFERHGVDIVFAGHEHNYERTVPIRESTTASDRAVRYVVSGGGGAPLYPSGTSSWTAFSASRHEYVKVAIDSCTLTLNAIGLDGTVFDSNTVDKCDTPPAALPEGWSHADIGNTGVAGNASAASGTFSVAGAGADVWGTADALHYAYRTLDGDGTIVARVATIQNVHAWTKTGVMIRNSLSPSSAQAFMLVAASAAKGVPFQRRPIDGGSTVSSPGSLSTAPRWVKLVRSGNLITGYESANGTTWTVVGSDTFAMGSTVLIGLAVSSHVTGVNATATFDNVTVTQATTPPPPPPNSPPTVSLNSPTAGATFTAPAQIGLVAAASDSDGTINKVDFYAGAALIGTATTSPFTATWSNVPAGSYTLKAVATDNGGAATTSSLVSITANDPAPPPAPLPDGWRHADIGNTGITGDASAASGTFTVAGAGADVWGTADALHYAYRTLDGDGTIVARVATIQNVHAWTKVGVMIRNSLAPSSAQAFMLVAASAAKGVPFQRRPIDGGSTVSSPGSLSTAPRWVKLVRAGNLITGYESANGTTWTVVGSDTFAMGSTVLIGLGVSSHVTGVNATATFDNVTVTQATAPPPPPPNSPPSVSLNSPTAGATFTAPAQIGLAAAASDSDGTIAKVDFYAGTTLIGTATTSPFTATWSNVPAGSYTLKAVATDNGGATTTSNLVPITVDDAPSTLPAGWSHADIGGTGAAGGASAAGGTFTVTGAGADVWGTADALHYAYRTLTGDGTIVARVTTIENVHAWTKTGVMIRNSLSPSSAQAFMLVAASPLKGVPFQRRKTDGGTSTSSPGSQSTAPRWVKLVRTGSVITGYESADGVAWSMVGSDTFAMGPTVLIGLGVSSHVTGVNATATFDNVTVTGGQ